MVIGERSYYGPDGSKKMILGGDIILEVAGIPLLEGKNAAQEIQNRLSRMSPKDKITVKVLRAGRVLVLSTKRGN
jgi:S1-C subfamily serine protease